MSEEIPKDLRYTPEHEWVSVKENTALVGITFHAQDALGEIVYVELPEVGTELKKGDTLGAVESVKAANDLYSPISGKVLKINTMLADDPGQVNSDPYNAAWMIALEITNPQELDTLIDADAYKKIISSL